MLGLLGGLLIARWPWPVKIKAKASEKISSDKTQGPGVSADRASDSLSGGILGAKRQESLRDPLGSSMACHEYHSASEW
jgi:hypothetical protein